MSIFDVTGYAGNRMENPLENEWVQFGARHNCTALAEQFRTAGRTIADLTDHVLQKQHGLKPAAPSALIGMGPGEVTSYSIVRALRCLADHRPLDGLEKEASDATAKVLRRDPEGFFIPVDVATRAMSAGEAPKGGFVVSTVLAGSSMIELLRNKMVTAFMGARVLSGLTGNVAVPKNTGGATAYWLDETGTVTASDQSFKQLALTPHRLAAHTLYSKQLLFQSSLDVESFVRDDLTSVLAIEKDRAALNGSGASGEPVGILNTTGINTVTFGAAPTWAKVVDFEKEVETDNVISLSTLTGGYISTPVVKAKWKTTVKVSGQAVYIWEAGDMVNSYKAASTKQVPSDKVIFGYWPDLLIADWGGWDVTVDPYTNAKTNQMAITVQTHADIAIRHEESFCVSTDSGAQ